MEHLLRNTFLSMVLAAILYGVLYYFVDIPVANMVKNLPGSTLFNINRVLTQTANLRIWTAFLMLGLIGAAFYEYQYGSRPGCKALLYVILSILIASFIGDCLKYFLGRYRPQMLYEQGLYGFQFLSMQWEASSTPSGHTLRIFSLMTALGFLYKPYRVYFYAFALLVGISRVILHAHFPSDIVFGAYVGILSAVWVRWYMFYRKAC